MMNIHRITAAAIAAVCLLALLACGNANQKNMYTKLQQTHNGAEADKLATELGKSPSTAKDLGLAPGMLDHLRREAWAREAADHLTTLRTLRNEPVKATVERDAFLAAVKNSGKPVADFGTTEHNVNVAVGYNHVQAAKEHLAQANGLGSYLDPVEAKQFASPASKAASKHSPPPARNARKRSSHRTSAPQVARR